MMKKIVLEALKANEIIKTELIQELWSGYGELSRITTDKGSVVLKLVKFPNSLDHPKGWATNLGHERKVKSYQVEKSWYESFQEEIPGAKRARGLAFGESQGSEYLLLEDLKESGFRVKHKISWTETERCLSWLAHFHKHFLNFKGEKANLLWEVGTYWHLATRPEELQAMDDHLLKGAASYIDEKLNEARFQTIVHGDAKLANFLFSENDVAAVDFQYVGGGVGVKDVAYFLSSLYEEDELFKIEEKALNTYFKYLDLPEVEQEWRKLYSIAWCDFYRFLKGWSPGHWKINSYSESMKETALNFILLDMAKKAALKAGEVIGEHQGKEVNTKFKEGGTSLASKVFTEVDLMAEKAIHEVLLPTLELFNLGLLTEETPDDLSRFERNFFWCIDPLDGTLPFSKNESGYSTSIALVSKQGEAILGVVYDPREENLYYALKGQGAFKNKSPFKIQNHQGEVTLIDGPGGAVMQAISTIENAPCLFIKAPKEEEGGGCLWDYAATSVIHHEAGGLNSDYSFNPLDLNSSKSLFMNHCGVIFSSGMTREEVAFKIGKGPQEENL